MFCDTMFETHDQKRLNKCKQHYVLNQVLDERYHGILRLPALLFRHSLIELTSNMKLVQ